jgi:hypothetical protein
MQERGVTPSVVENTISNTPSQVREGGKYLHENSELRVIVNALGEVVTVVAK